MKYADIESAYIDNDFSSESSVYINKQTGQVLYHSEYEMDEENEIDFFDENLVSLPDKRELNLGSRMVFKFADKKFKEEYETIKYYFSKKGAYSKFRNLLEKRNKVDEWYKFENQETEAALRNWCSENGINLDD